MAYGIRIRDAAGNIVLDTSDSTKRIARLLGVISTGTSSGSQAFDAGGGQLCFTVVSSFVGYSQGPDVQLSGNTIIWTAGGLTQPASIFVWAF